MSKNKHKLLVVEDDLLMARIVQEIVRVNFPEIEVLPITNSVSGAVASIDFNKPEIVILDININEGTAFDILNQINSIDFKVIFMSSFHEKLVEALQFSAVEFVYKPFDVSDMISAIDKALASAHVEEGAVPYAHQIETLLENVNLHPGSNKLVLPGVFSHRIVPIRDILWIEAKVSKSLFNFVKNGSFVVKLPMRRYESMLKSRGFYRCHPHFLINLAHVEYVDPVLGQIQLSEGTVIGFESRKYEDLMIQLHIFKALPTIR